MAHKLYSKDGEYPTRLGRIRMPDGTTRTDGTTFTDEEIELAGYTGPYYEPEYDSENQYLEWDSEELEFVIKDYPADRLLANLRELRDRELRNSDWTQLDDAPLSDLHKSRWAVYREKLRNLPEDLNSPPASMEEVNEVMRKVLTHLSFSTTPMTPEEY